MSAKLFTIKLDEDECRTLEIEISSIVRKLRERTALAPSMAADQLIDRYLSVVAKIRKARGLDEPNPKAKARDGYRAPAKTKASA